MKISQVRENLGTIAVCSAIMIGVPIAMSSADVIEQQPVKPTSTIVSIDASSASGGTLSTTSKGNGSLASAAGGTSK